MPFGMGIGELILMILIVVVVFGGTKLPRLGERLSELLQDRPDPRLLQAPEPERWTGRDWLRVGVAVTIGVLAVLSIVMPRSP